MEKFLPHYARELGFFRRFSREFAERYPRIAANLLIHGEASEDPHVEHMIEAFAFLTARIAKRLDDDYPQLTEALLEALYPHYLRAFPSCSIVRIERGGPPVPETMSVTLIPRATPMTSEKVRDVACTFQSAYEVALAPLALSEVKFTPHIVAPGSMRMPAQATTAIRITLRAMSAEAALAQLELKRLRVFIDGEPSFCAALRDALFLRAAGAWIEADGDGQWHALGAIPVAAVGFAEQDALIPFSTRSHPAYRLLTEYFSFPDKFNFFDLELDPIRALLPARCRCFTLHLALKGILPDTNVARLLATLSPNNLVLGCTPVVNLFQMAGNPIDVSHTQTDYTLLADPARAFGYEIHDIDSAQLSRSTPAGELATPLRPFYALRDGETPAAHCHYWILRHDQMMASKNPGYETRLALVDTDFNPMAPETTTLSTMLTCSNRDLPCLLGVGLAGGDLHGSGRLEHSTIRFLRKPSPPYRFEAGRGAHWRLVSHLSLNYRSLCEAGLADFRSMLALHDLPRSAISQRQISGIVALRHQVVMTWIAGVPHSALMPGVEVRMTLDEEAFIGSGVAVFAQLIDRFLALYGQINVFTQLIVLSNQTGEELLRCLPRSAISPLA